MLALPADLLGVGTHRLVAMVAIGDQQLRLARGPLHRGDRLWVGDAPQPVYRAVRVCDLTPRRHCGGWRQRVPGGVRGVGVEREDGGDVRARRARQAQPVLLRAGVRALVGTDPTGAVVLDAHPAEKPTPRARLAVGTGVVLCVRPQRGLTVTDQRPL